MHFADRLVDAVRGKQTPLCVGLDPRWELLPESVRQRHGDSHADKARAYEEFCLRLLEIVAPLVGIVKAQSAFFEACGSRGMQALQRVMQHSRQLGLVVILDAKRNDIASTAEAYADAAFRIYEADALTINAYLGRDSVEPFLQTARSLERGLFVLVRTSNPGAGQFQDLQCNGWPLYAHVADAVTGWSRENPGRYGFGDVGAVLGATNPAELAGASRLLTGSLILVPGYGAQGASAADTAGAFCEDGTGAIINSSRAVLYPIDPSAATWEEAVEKGTRRAIDELARQTPAGRLRFPR